MQVWNHDYCVITDGDVVVDDNLKYSLPQNGAFIFLIRKSACAFPEDWTCVFSVIDRDWTEIFQVWRREEKISLQVDMRNLFSGMQI